MSKDPAAVLRILLAIPQRAINQDLLEAEKDLIRLVDGTFSSHLRNRKNRDPEVSAEHYHKQMIRGKALQSMDTLHEDHKFIFAVMPAEEIAEEAVSVAHQRGRLAELGRRMEEIQIREGLQDDEFWPIGEGPEDYQALSEESEGLYESVHASVFTTILRRYRLKHIADLFENDRASFDARANRGRKAVFGGRN